MVRQTRSRRGSLNGYEFVRTAWNGYPIAAVVGRAAVMEAATNTWISSTLAGEATGLAAIGGVLDWHDRTDVCDTLWRTGEEMIGAVKRAIAASGAEGVSVEGIAPMWFLKFDTPEHESIFLEAALEQDVLFKRGAYNYAAVAHEEQTLIDIAHAASSAFVRLVEETQG